MKVRGWMPLAVWCPVSLPPSRQCLLMAEAEIRHLPGVGKNPDCLGAVSPFSSGRTPTNTPKLPGRRSFVGSAKRPQNARKTPAKRPQSDFDPSWGKGRLLPIFHKTLILNNSPIFREFLFNAPRPRYRPLRPLFSGLTASVHSGIIPTTLVFRARNSRGL